MAGDAIVGRIVGLLEVKDTTFTSGMTKARTQFSGLHSDMQSKGKAITGVISGIGQAMIAVGAVAWLKGAINEAIIDEAALVKLKTAVSAAGQSWADYGQGMEDAARAGIALGFEDDVTTNALAKLTIMTGDAAKAQADLSLAQDLARGTGMDLAAAASLVAKVEEGRIGIAARQLPFLKATMTQEEAMAALREHLAGQSAAYAKTAAGAAAIWNASYKELQKTIGDRLLPAFTGIVKGATAIIGAFAGADKSTQTFIITLAGLGAIATKLGGLPGFIISIGAAVNYTADTMLTQGAAGFGAYIQGMMGTRDASEGLVRSIIQAVPATRSLYEMSLGAGTVQRIMGEKATGASSAEDALAASMAEVAGATADAAAETKGYTDQLVYAVNALTLTQTAEQTALKDKVAVKAAASALADAIHKYGKNSDEARLARINLTEAENRAKDSAAVAKDATDGTAQSAGKAAAKWNALKDAINRANAAYRASPMTGSAIRVPGHQYSTNAAGGVFTKPTLGVFGEAGTEVIVPTKGDANSRALLATAASLNGVSGGGSVSSVTNYFTITANVSNDYDVDRLAERLQRIQSTRARAIGATA